MGNGVGRHESVIGITAVQVEFVAHSKLTAQRWRQQGVGGNEVTTHRCVTCRVVDAIKRTTEQICESRGDVVMSVILVFWNVLAGGVQNDGIVWGCQEGGHGAAGVEVAKCRARSALKTGTEREGELHLCRG